MTAPDIAPGRLLLAGLTGSRAHGTHRPDSDYDYKGFYLAPTHTLNGIYPPVMKQLTYHVPKVEPVPGDDREVGVSYHELAKGLHLMLSSNPDILELLWLKEYDVLTPEGEELLEMRMLFPTQSKVRSAYSNYAARQFDLLLRHGRIGNGMDKRLAKHARHLLRLLREGYLLYTEGCLQVTVDDPDELVEFGERVAAYPTAEEAAKLIRKYDEMFESATSVLRIEPDIEWAEDFLLRLRKKEWA